MFSAYLGKYRSIIVSVALFIILDASVLMLNFYISFEISEDATGVNLAGRQRMLSQRMVKSLFDIEYSQGDSSLQLEAKQELAFTISIFDKTLTAFDKGGPATAADGDKVELEAVTSDKGRAAINDAKTLWLTYKSLLQSISNSPNNDISTNLLTDAISYAKKNNLTLLALMNDLTVDLENVASSKATRLRIIQTIGISLAIINFFIILFHFMGELRSNDRKLERANAENRKILDAVTDGLFLVDRDFTIASQHSKKVSSMFGKSDISGKSFEEVLADLINHKDMETSKRFIHLLFRDDIKSKLIGDLNPLKEIQINISDDEGGYTIRYLSFNFSRAYENDMIKNVLITVNDITDKILLEKELASAKEQTEQQLEVLTGILHTNPSILRRFINECFDRFDRINLLLREPAKSDTLMRKKLDNLFIEMHSFKGEAGALELQSFQDMAHTFENEITHIKENKSITGDNFFPLIVLLEKFIRHAENVRNLSHKLSEFGHAQSDGKTNKPKSSQWQHLYNLTQNIAQRANKQVELLTSGLSEVALSRDLETLINDISVQCIRNAVIHGIESPQDRSQSSKKETGKIHIRLIQDSKGTIELSIKDDGQGLNYESIRTKAFKSGQWTEQEIESWDTKKLMSLIFETGFSTQANTTLDAGRGVGLDVIKNRIKQFRGKINLSSKQGMGTYFTITIPPAIQQDMPIRSLHA